MFRRIPPLALLGLVWIPSLGRAELISSPPPVQVQLTVQSDDRIDNFDLTLFYNGDQRAYSGGNILYDPDYTVLAGLEVDPDPFVNGVFGVRNSTALEKSYTVTVSLPIFPAVTPFSLFGGSVGLTLTDANFNGFARVRDVGVSVYQAQTDGVTVLTLLDAPFSLQVNVPGQSAVANQVLGLPGPTLPGGPVNTSISIVHQFRLSPGDIVGFTSFFVVEAVVPEVGTVWLAGGVLAVLGGIVIRRRRS